ncbi:MAG: ABC transporter permease, partial [Bryobacterales bacterium]|nr:ABC transporter permease [Bryobacterales bacterium]
MRSDLRNDLIRLSAEHLSLVASAMLIAIVVGIPLGILISRRPGAKWLLNVSGVIQTIPSLALFGFLIPVPFIAGIGKSTVIVALVLYALL